MPNFFEAKKGLNNYAIIDMPGYADNSRLRELINFHYIETMLKNLEEVRFLIVVNMFPSNGSFKLNPYDLKMMENFSEMFPECRDHVSLIINRLESKGGKSIDNDVRLALNRTF